MNDCRQSHHKNPLGFTSTLFASAFAAGLALCASAAFASGGGAGHGAAGAGAGAGPGAGNAQSPPSGSTDLTTCPEGKVWDVKTRKCLTKRSGVLPDPALTEYAFALAKAQRYQEAIDVLDTLNDPNTPRALNYRGYAMRKLGHTEEGIAFYLKSVALDPNYAQVREYLGEAYVLQGKIDLAKDQLATIEKICGSRECEEYEDLATALTEAHAL
jgi:tetratricopeptide (TPR) repeat protein